jgi:aryl-alcohol dehydrogenase-like predicted oxidoreductase
MYGRICVRIRFRRRKRIVAAVVIGMRYSMHSFENSGLGTPGYSRDSKASVAAGRSNPQASSSSTSNGIPLRKLGRHDVQVSALGFGGHHLGDAQDRPTAERIVHEAIDGGITFFDNCWEYHNGKSEVWMGGALKGRRDRVFLMTKVCTHGRDGWLATQMLEQSLRRLQTDHLDLWQIHGVGWENDPDLFIRPGGAAEALVKAKEQGKVRFVGFTGHKDANVHKKMLDTGFPFDAVQMPLNAFDAGFAISFQKVVLPVLNQKGIAPLGMKPLSGHGEPITGGELSAEEALRYAMSLPVATIITGMEKLEVLRQNLKIAQNFRPMTPDEMRALETRTAEAAADARFELYKVSLKFDNPQARLAHEFPLDDQSEEVKEMLQATRNTGHAFPEIK